MIYTNKVIEYTHDNLGIFINFCTNLNTTSKYSHESSVPNSRLQFFIIPMCPFLVIYTLLQKSNTINTIELF